MGVDSTLTDRERQVFEYLLDGRLDRAVFLAEEMLDKKFPHGIEFAWPRESATERPPVEELLTDVIRESTKVQAEIMAEALRVYERRNEKYKDNWRRFGWRGCLFRIRERAERAWDDLWDQEPMATQANPEPTRNVPNDADDLIDLINFAVFAIRAIREGNRDGSWWGFPGQTSRE